MTDGAGAWAAGFASGILTALALGFVLGATVGDTRAADRDRATFETGIIEARAMHAECKRLLSLQAVPPEDRGIVLGHGDAADAVIVEEPKRGATVEWGGRIVAVPQ